jgi:type III pantothenate kinase
VLLTVDVGNSQTVLATFDGPRRVGCWRVTTAPRATSDELRMLWRGLLRDTEVTGVSACSTVPALLPALRALLDSLAVPVSSSGPGVRTGVPLHVDNPREVGADRVVTALAAHELYGRRPTAACARSSSSTSAPPPTSTPSAPTDSSSAARCPRRRGQPGGAGRPARAAALGELTVPPQAIGKNTVAALQSGLVLGFAGWSTGWWPDRRELVAQFGAAPVVVATGGLAPLVADSCRSIAEREPDLTVHGLRLAFERQQAPGRR